MNKRCKPLEKGRSLGLLLGLPYHRQRLCTLLYSTTCTNSLSVMGETSVTAACTTQPLAFSTIHIALFYPRVGGEEKRKGIRRGCINIPFVCTHGVYRQTARLCVTIYRSPVPPPPPETPKYRPKQCSFVLEKRKETQAVGDIGIDMVRACPPHQVEQSIVYI